MEAAVESIETAPEASTSKVVPALRSIPPAVAVIPIASAAVPAVFVNVIFSLPAVPCGAKTISVAAFLPSVNV